MEVRLRMKSAKKGQRVYVGACDITFSGYRPGNKSAFAQEHTLASRGPGNKNTPDAASKPSRAKLAARGMGEGRTGALAKAIGLKADKRLHRRICERIETDEARLTRRITGKIVSDLIADFASGKRF